MQLPHTLTLKNQSQNVMLNKSFVQNNNNLSSRSFKMNLVDNKSKQKMREVSFEEQYMTSYYQLPLVEERGTHLSRFDQISPSKSRGIILLGDNTRVKKKYEFGDEGVKVCEEVVQKYKASNYTIQRGMLQKFKREAQEFRRKRNNRGRNGQDNNKIYNQVKQVPFYQTNDLNTSITQQNLSFVQMKRKQMERKAQFQKELQRRNNVIRRLREQQQLAFKQKQRKMEKQKRKKAIKQIYLKRQKQNLIQVGNMLRQIDQKIKESSSQLQQSLKGIRNELSPKGKMQPFKVIKIIPNKFSQPLDQNDFESYANQLLELRGSRPCKLPVVLYNNRYYDARSYFADSNNVPSPIERASSNENAQDVQNIVKILKRNEQRIKMLTQDYQFKQ